MSEEIKIQNLVDGFHKVERDGLYFDLFKEGQIIYLVGIEDRQYNKINKTLNEVSQIFGITLEDGSEL